MGTRNVRGSVRTTKVIPLTVSLIPSLKKAYLLLDSLHGPKETDIDMLSELSKTGLAHQIVLTKLDRAPATLWTQLGAALRQNPVRAAPHKAAARLPSRAMEIKSVDELKMGVWAPLRGQLALGCDETILGISSVEGWGIGALRVSILKACGALKKGDVNDVQYLKALQEAPIIEEGQGSEPADDDSGSEEMLGVNDDNPSRGEFFGGKETFRKKIHRW